MSARKRIAVYCGTRNLYHQMATVAKSIMMYGAERVIMLAEDDALGEPLPDCVTVLNVSGQQYFSRDGPNYHSRYTYMALMRAALTKLLPDCDIVLSLDTDTIAQRDVSTLWDVNLAGCCLAAVPEPMQVSMAARRELVTGVCDYYNSGVVMMNLALLRDGTDERMIHTLNTRELKYPEQDAMNILCAGRIRSLPPEYNTIRFFYPDIPEHDIRIRHYVSGVPPIRHELAFRRLERMTWNYILECKKRQAGEKE